MNNFSQFWDQVIEVWRLPLLGSTVERLVVAAFLFALFLLLRRALAHSFVGGLKKLAARTQTMFDDLAIDALEQPLTLAPIAFGVFIASQTLGLDGQSGAAANMIIQTLIAIMIFWGLYRLVNPMAHVLRPMERVFSYTLVEWLRQALRVFFIFLGAVSVLTIWGIPVVPILASFSLLSVAVALGAQDFFKNLIAGASIIAERRFKPGDWILVDGVLEGTVERINFRSTAVRRFDKAVVDVPNSQLADNAVTNFSKMTHRRIYWKIGVEYRTSVDQLRAIRDNIEEYVLNNDEFAHPPEVSTFVRIDAFNDSSIDIMLYCFTKTTRWGEWLAIKEALAYRVKQIVEGAGSAFAFPSRSLYVESPPEDTPELFVPP
ncbi:MAG: mechanosensitive ion channel family protein, partial [Pseudomonadota bacterium]